MNTFKELKRSELRHQPVLNKERSNLLKQGALIILIVFLFFLNLAGAGNSIKEVKISAPQSRGEITLSPDDHTTLVDFQFEGWFSSPKLTSSNIFQLLSIKTELNLNRLKTLGSKKHLSEAELMEWIDIESDLKNKPIEEFFSFKELGIFITSEYIEVKVPPPGATASKSLEHCYTREDFEEFKKYIIRQYSLINKLAQSHECLKLQEAKQKTEKKLDRLKENHLEMNQIRLRIQQLIKKGGGGYDLEMLKKQLTKAETKIKIIKKEKNEAQMKLNNIEKLLKSCIGQMVRKISSSAPSFIPSDQFKQKLPSGKTLTATVHKKKKPEGKESTVKDQLPDCPECSPLAETSLKAIREYVHLTKDFGVKELKESIKKLEAILVGVAMENLAVARLELAKERARNISNMISVLQKTIDKINKAKKEMDEAIARLNDCIRKCKEKKKVHDMGLDGCWLDPENGHLIFIKQQGNEIIARHTYYKKDFRGILNTDSLSLTLRYNFKNADDLSTVVWQEGTTPPKKVLEQVPLSVRHIDFSLKLVSQDKLEGTFQGLWLDWNKTNDKLNFAKFYSKAVKWERKNASLNSLTVTDNTFKKKLAQIKIGERFWIKARASSGCPQVADQVVVNIYVEGKEPEAVKIRLIETGANTLEFHSLNSVVVSGKNGYYSIRASPGDKLIVRSGLRGATITVKKPSSSNQN